MVFVSNLSLVNFFSVISMLFLCAISIRITKQGGYKGIIVSINEDVPEDPHLLLDLQQMVSTSSRLLFTATDRRAYFEDVIVKIPDSWSPKALHEEDNYLRKSNSVAQEPHILIGNEDPEMGDIPHARQLRGCGEPGVYIHLTPGFLRRQKGKSDGDIMMEDLIFAQEWAKFRYGIFPEHGIPGDPRYPLFYWINNEVKPTIGVEGISGWVQTKEGNKCKMYRGGVVENGCRFVINATKEIEKFIMPALPFLASLEKSEELPSYFRVEHDDECPSPQNILCNHRSSWNIVENAKDFRKVTSKLKSTEPPRTKFRMVKAKSRQKREVPLPVDANIYDSYIKIYSPEKMTASLTGEATMGVSNSEKFNSSRSEKDIENIDLESLVEELMFSESFTETNEFQVNEITSVEELIKKMDDEIIPNGSMITVIFPEDIATGRNMKEMNAAGHSVLQVIPQKEARRNLQMYGIIISNKAERKAGLEDYILSNEGKRIHIELSEGASSYSIRTKLQSAIFDVMSHSAIEGHQKETDPFWLFIIRRNDLVISLKAQIIFKPRVGGETKAVSQLTTEDDEIVINKWINLVPGFPWKVFRLLIEVKKGGAAVLDAYVIANVTKPESGGTNELVLRDDGTGADMIKNDGVYSAFFINTDEIGHYQVLFEIKGLKNESKITQKKDITSEIPYLFSSDIKDFSANGPSSTYFTQNDFTYVDISAPEPQIDATIPLLQDFTRIITDVDSMYVAAKKGNESTESTLPPSKIRDLRILDVVKAAGNLTISIEWTATGAYLNTEPATSLEVRISPPGINLRRQFYCGIEIDSSYIVEGTLEPLNPGEIHRLVFTIPEQWITEFYTKGPSVENNTENVMLPLKCFKKRLDLSGLLQGVQLGIAVGSDDNSTKTTSNIAFFSLKDVSDNIHTVGDALGIDKKITTIVAGVVVGIIQLILIIVVIKRYKNSTASIGICLKKS